MTGPNHLAEAWYYNITCDVTARAGRSVRTASAEGLTNRNLLPDDLRGLAWEPLPFSLILKDNTDEGWMRRVSGTPASANSIAFDIDENLDYYPLCRGCLGVLRARFPFNLP